MTISDNPIFPDSLHGNILPFRRPQPQNVFDSNDPIWEGPVLRRLEHLVRLESGWDGYHAPHVTFSVATFAYSMLNSICGPHTPPPSIVPGPGGDLQIEWHPLAGDIELHVRSPNDVVAWRSTNELDGEEVYLTNNFSEIAAWVRELMEPTIATASSAA